MSRPTWEERMTAQIPSGVRERFVILHEGWEMDNVGWIANDGRIWTTNHGRLQSMNRNELETRIQEAEASLRGLRRALDSIDSLDNPGVQSGR